MEESAAFVGTAGAMLSRLIKKYKALNSFVAHVFFYHVHCTVY
jgi:hypothetical protein